MAEQDFWCKKFKDKQNESGDGERERKKEREASPTPISIQDLARSYLILPLGNPQVVAAIDPALDVLLATGEPDQANTRSKAFYICYDHPAMTILSDTLHPGSFLGFVLSFFFKMVDGGLRESDLVAISSSLF